MAQRAGISVSVRGRLGAEASRRRDPEEPFRLLLLGDFSGRLNRASLRPLARPRRVELTELDDVFASFDAEVTLPARNGTFEIYRPRSLEDLHPDALIANLQGLNEAYQLLCALNAPRVPSEALAAARAYVGQHQSTTAPHGATNQPDPEPSDAATIDRLLGRAPSPGASPERAANPLSALFEDAVRDHKVDSPSAERDLLQQELERLLTRALQDVLHAPAFRALEGCWRGADRVIRALGTDEALEIALFDVSLPELVAAFAETENPEGSELHRQLVDASAGWTLLAADFEFGSSDADLTALAGLGALSARAGGALLAGASPQLFGCATAAELTTPRAWTEQPPHALFHALRESPLAERIGLAFPRLLGRARYSKKGDAIEAFGFDEFAPDEAESAPRTWSSAAFGVAELVGRAFRDSGWGFSSSMDLTLTDLPCETVVRDGERVLLPPAEAYVEQRAAEALLSRGVMPLLGRRDQASLRLLTFVSIAHPAKALAGVDTEG